MIKRSDCELKVLTYGEHIRAFAEFVDEQRALGRGGFLIYAGAHGGPVDGVRPLTTMVVRGQALSHSHTLTELVCELAETGVFYDIPTETAEHVIASFARALGYRATNLVRL